MEIQHKKCINVGAQNSGTHQNCVNCCLKELPKDDLNTHKNSNHLKRLHSLSTSMNIKKAKSEPEVMEVDVKEAVMDKTEESVVKTLVEKEVKNKVAKKSPAVRELTGKVKEALGDSFVLYPIEGDGICGPRSAAAFLGNDQSLGYVLARSINDVYIHNWSHWKDFFSHFLLKQL